MLPHPQTHPYSFSRATSLSSPSSWNLIHVWWLPFQPNYWLPSLKLWHKLLLFWGTRVKIFFKIFLTLALSALISAQTHTFPHCALHTPCLLPTSLTGFTNPSWKFSYVSSAPIDQGPTRSKQYFLDLRQNNFHLSTLCPKCCFTLKHGAIRRMGDWWMNSGADIGLLWHLSKLLVPQNVLSHMLNAFVSIYYDNIVIKLDASNTAL